MGITNNQTSLEQACIHPSPALDSDRLFLSAPYSLHLLRLGASEMGRPRGLVLVRGLSNLRVYPSLFHIESNQTSSVASLV